MERRVGEILEKGQRLSSAQQVGAMLRDRRKELGYTQLDISEMLGYSPRLVGEIERGRGTVGYQKIIDYATGLGVDLYACARGQR